MRPSNDGIPPTRWYVPVLVCVGWLVGGIIFLWLANGLRWG